jgi:uncharacterized membrane protein
MASNHKQLAKTLSERAQISAILWLIIGIIQVISLAGVICGAWNIYCAYCRFKQSKAVLTPYPGLVQSYDKWMTNIIVSIVINVLLGGVIGVAAAIFDLLAIRGYVLENKQTFEEMEADPSLAA